MSVERAGVTCLICCYNSELRIARTIRDLAAARGTRAVRVVLVDNRCTDKTVEVATRVAAEVGLAIEVVREETPGLTSARSRGFKAAHNSRFVLLVDDDVSLRPGYIDYAAELMDAHPEVGACGGQGEAFAEGAEIPQWLRKSKMMATGPQGSSEGEISDTRGYLYGAGLFIRGAAISSLNAGGFNFLLTDRVGSSLSSGGDAEFCFALRICGWKLWYSPSLAFQHWLTPDRLSIDYGVKLSRSCAESSIAILLYRLSMLHGVALADSRSLHKQLRRRQAQLIYTVIDRRLRILCGSTAPHRLRVAAAEAQIRVLQEYIRSGKAHNCYSHILRFRSQAAKGFAATGMAGDQSSPDTKAAHA